MSGPRTLSKVVPAIAGKALGKRGLAFGALIGDWATIVGPQLAARTVPHKLAFPPGRREDATLHVRVTGAYALDLQHAEPQILERINGFFGYRAVARLKLLQGPPTLVRPRGARERPLTRAEETAIAQAAAPVEDDSLREALTRLGRTLRSQAPS